MKTAALLLCFLSLFTFTLSSQAIIQGDTVYYPEIHSVAYEQVVYKTAVQMDEINPVINENLALRVYYPDDLEPGERRPLVVLVHGGGFIGGSYVSFFDEAENLASLGYIAVSVQYRLCKRVDCVVAAGLAFPCNVSWGNSLIPAGYMAAVDVADAIQWLQLHAEEYHIDTERIAVGGHSAGGWTSLHMAFMDMDEIQEFCPSCGTWPDYIGETLDSLTGIRAVLNMSGALLDTTWIDPDEAHIDVMSIHGTDDGVVFYGTGPVYPCCNTYQTPISGSCPITARMNELDGDYYLLSGVDYGHDVFESQWWDQSQPQILWFLAKALMSDDDYSVHVEMVRPNPVLSCPEPLPPIVPAELCNFSLTGTKIVLFEAPVSNVLAPIEKGIRIWPNPGDERLFIESDKESITFIQLIDSQGNVVRQFQPQGNQVEVEISHFSPGLYILDVQTAEGRQLREKVLIQR